MIFSLVAMTGLEKCCITSAYLQWLCHSGERPVARGPLVLLCNYLPWSRNPMTHPCALHNFDTFRHILIILGRDEEEDQKGCGMHERQLSLSLICSYLTWSRNLLTHLYTLHNIDTLWHILILGRNEEGDQWVCRVKRNNSHFLSYVAISPWSQSLVQTITPILFWDNLIILGRDEEEDHRLVVCKRDNSDIDM